MALLDSDTVDGTRYVNFFSSTAHQPDRALDIRMYRQDVMYDKYIRHGDNVAVGTKSKLARLAKTRVGGLNVLSAVISESFTALLFAFVGLKAWGGAFGVGSVTQYVGAVALMSVGIAEFVKFGGAVINNASALKVFFAFLDMPNAMFQGSLTTEKRSDHKYEIEFRNVSFKYNSASVYALKNISLKFEIGKRLAIVGQNGSGKTTFIKLLCRLYDPTEGEILLNGIDIRKYDYLQYMAIYAVVFQDFRLLSAALGQNVAAAASFDGAQAADCLEKAGFGERLKTMPDGLDTLLFKDLGGIDVSGGESQKIALARALYKSAHFAVLDEPTAALDPVAEFEVYTKMNEIVGEKTAVFISHRLSSCRFCSDIAVFHEGVLTQRGNHETLIADAGGKYYELWNAQAQYYTE
jgi:ATP-binding cassette subfamily B protein